MSPISTAKIGLTIRHISETVQAAKQVIANDIRRRIRAFRWTGIGDLE